MTRLFAAILGAVALLAVGQQPAIADHVKPTIDVGARASDRSELGYIIDARLRTADGKAIGDAAIRFYELVTFVGPREMFLGGATTDSQGVASIAYLPALTGTRQIVARFAGCCEHIAAAEARFALEATIAKPAFRQERQPLAAFSDRVPYVVGVLVLAVWGLIGFALFAAARGVIGGARGASRKEGPA